MEATNTTAQQLVGQPVSHRAFGSGVIESLKGNVITVNFSQGDKRFIYPDAFRNFLKLEDEEGRDQFMKLMQQRKEKIEKKKEIIREKDETRRKFRSQKIAANSQAVFNLSEEDLKECMSRGWAFTGRYQSGFSEGRARTAGRIKPNSLCMLTSLKKGSPESEREIKALYMAHEDFYGDECTDGRIMASEKYRLLLGDSDSIKIWENADETDIPKRFGGLKYRYVSENTALNVLKALKEKLGEDKQEFMEEFINYYCRLNSLSIN